MSRRPAALLALLMLSSALSALPAAGASGPEVADLFLLPAGAQGLVAAGSADGSLLVAVPTPVDTQFFEVPASPAEPVRALAPFPFVATAEASPWSAPRLASSPDGLAAVVFESDARVRAALVDPNTGVELVEKTLSPAGEVGLYPSVAWGGGSFVAAYYSVGPAGARACAVALDPASGAESWRACEGVAGTPYVALASQGDSVYLLASGPTATRVFDVAAGGLALRGVAEFGGRAGALAAAGGSVTGVVSDGTSTYRVSARLDDLSRVSRAALPAPAGSTGIIAAVSADGRLAAAGSSAGAMWVLGESGLSQYTVSAQPQAFAAAGATDAYGLARVLLAGGPALSPEASGFAVGDPTSVRVGVAGPASVLPNDWTALDVTFTAVRSSATIVGMAVAAPSGWSVPSPSLSLSLSAGESGTATLPVHVPAGAPAGNYLIRITPAVVETSTPPSATFSVQVAEAQSPVTVSYSGGDLSLEPGQSKVIGVQVTNRGAGAAATEVRLSAEGASSLDIQPPASSVTIPSGATETVSFVVAAPVSALPEASTRLAFDVELPGSAVSLRADFAAAVRPVFAPQLSVLPGELGAAPGGTVTVPARVVNSGNAAGFVAVTASTLGLPADAVRVANPLVVVPAFGSVDAGVSVTVPADALADQRFSVTVAAWDEAGVPAGDPETRLGVVFPVSSVRASYEPGPAAAPGQTSTGTLTLTNDGNRRATFSLAFGSLEDGFAVHANGVPTEGITVEPFSSRDVPLVVRAPAGAAPGARQLAVTASSDASAPLLLPVSVQVAAVHSLGVRVLTPDITVHDPAVERVAVELALSSGSNTPETVAVTFAGASLPVSVLGTDGPAGDGESAGIVEVGPYETLTVRAFVDLGLVPRQTARTFDVAAQSLSGLSGSGSVSVHRPLADPRVLDLRTLAPVRSGGVHTVFANISNDGPSTTTGLVAKLFVDGVLVNPQSLTPLSPGTTRAISFTFLPHADAQVVTVQVVPDDPSFDADLSNNAASLTYATPGAAPAAPSGPLGGGQALPAAASFSLFALIGVALTEVGKSTFISLLLVPLYVKLKPGEVLDQYLRGQIHGYIIANPGEHYNAIKEQLGVTNGALAYHLRVLEKSGYIRATRDGMYKRFYPVGVKIPKRRRLSTFQETIVKTVRDQPALSQKDLAELLGVSNQVINYHIKQLEGASIIRLERDGRSSKIYLGPEAPPEEAPAGAAPATG